MKKEKFEMLIDMIRDELGVEASVYHAPAMGVWNISFTYLNNQLLVRKRYQLEEFVTKTNETIVKELRQLIDELKNAAGIAE